MLLRAYLEKKFLSQKASKLFIEKLTKKDLVVRRNDQHQIVKNHLVSDQILTIDKDNSNIGTDLVAYCLLYRTPFEVLERSEIVELQELLETEIRCLEKIKKEIDELLYYPYRKSKDKQSWKEGEKPITTTTTTEKQ